MPGGAAPAASSSDGAAPAAGSSGGAAPAAGSSGGAAPAASSSGGAAPAAGSAGGPLRHMSDGRGSRHIPYRQIKGRKPGPDVSPGELHISALPSTEFIANSESHH